MNSCRLITYSVQKDKGLYLNRVGHSVKKGKSLKYEFSSSLNKIKKNKLKFTFKTNLNIGTFGSPEGKEISISPLNSI